MRKINAKSFSFAPAEQTPNVAKGNIDRENNTLYAVSVCSEGEARGHNLFICKEFLHELAAIGNKSGMVKCHISHFNDCATADPLETRIGYAKNFRVSGSHCYADIVFLPTKHDEAIIDKIFTYAEKAPNLLGISIVFKEKIKEGKDGEEVYESYPDPQGKGRHFCTISELYACDIVGDPAIGDRLFSENFYTEAGYATKTLDKIKSQNKPLFDRIQEFALKYFSKPNEQQSKLKNMENSVKKALHNAFACACQNKGFGEAKDANGTLYRYPGDKPEVGDVLMIVAEDGTETPAPDGTYVMEDGTTVVVTDGIISEVTLPIVSEETDIESQENALSALKNQVKKQEQEIQKLLAEKQAEKAAEKIAELEVLNKKFEAIKGGFDKSISQKPKAAKVVHDKKDDMIVAFAKAMKGHADITKLDPKTGFRLKKTHLKNAKEYYDGMHAFATQIVGTANVVCEKYMKEVYQDLYYTDPVFTNTTRADLSGIYSETDIRDVKIPRMKVLPIAPATDILFPKNPTDCDNNTDAVTVRAEDTILQACFYKTALFLCPQNYRYLFENTVYFGAEEMPAQAIIVALLMNRVEREVARMLFGQKGITGSWCNGILQIVKNDITASLIPASQIFQYGVSISTFTAANVIAQVNQVIRAISKNAIQRTRNNATTIKGFISYEIWEMLLDAMALSDNAISNAYLDACCGIGNYNNVGNVRYPLAKNFVLELVPLEVFQDLGGPGKGMMLFVAKDEIYTGQYDLEQLPVPRIGYDVATDKIIARVDQAALVGYVNPANVTVVVPAP